MPSPSSSASNWDFTPVTNLLRAPTCPTLEQPTLDNCYSGSSIGSKSRSRYHESVINDVKTLTIQGHSLNDMNDVSSVVPRLGDFGALWELLGSSTDIFPASPNSGSPPEVRLPPSQQPPQPAKPISILKRPAKIEPDIVATRRVSPRTPPQLAPHENLASPCSSPLQDTAVLLYPNDDQRTKAKYELSSSESNTGAESDGAFSIFDRPLSKPRAIPSMVPPQIGIFETVPESIETPPSSLDELEDSLAPNGVKHMRSTGIIRVQPLTYKSAADRRVGLLTKLLTHFPDYAELVVQAGRNAGNKKKDVSARPVHVFVDMSNIMVGFHDSMKISRNIPVQTRIRRIPLSFQSFSLILERGRPTAKRVLVGSDRFAAVKEGEQLGYEANILDRVQKVKQPTSRQLKLRKNLRAISQDGGHSSEMNDAPGERWVEQGVDEILHLKILESLLDSDEPATIVLATGDAAEAEFSGGFMKMVERALQRGWRVELVSFSQVTSQAYRNKRFRARWREQFQLIELDGYIEELLDDVNLPGVSVPQVSKIGVYSQQCSAANQRPPSLCLTSSMISRLLKFFRSTNSFTITELKSCGTNRVISQVESFAFQEVSNDQAASHPATRKKAPAPEPMGRSSHLPRPRS